MSERDETSSSQSHGLSLIDSPSNVWAMQDVITVDGAKVPLEFSKQTGGDSKGGTVTTAVIVTGVLFWPAAPFWGFKKGKDAKVPAGTRFGVTVHGNATVQAHPLIRRLKNTLLCRSVEY